MCPFIWLVFLRPLQRMRDHEHGKAPFPTIGRRRGGGRNIKLKANTIDIKMEDEA